MHFVSGRDSSSTIRLEASDKPLTAHHSPLLINHLSVIRNAHAQVSESLSSILPQATKCKSIASYALTVNTQKKRKGHTAQTACKSGSNCLVTQVSDAYKTNMNNKNDTKDKLSWDKIHQLHEAVSNFSKQSFDIKKLWITVEVSAITLMMSLKVVYRDGIICCTYLLLSTRQHDLLLSG